MSILIKNGKIDSVRLGVEDHGILTAMVNISHDGGGQVFGGYAFSTSLTGKNACGIFIGKVLRVAGVTWWEDLPGQVVRVKIEGRKIIAIGHVINDHWFNPVETFEKMDT